MSSVYQPKHDLPRVVSRRRDWFVRAPVVTVTDLYYSSCSLKSFTGQTYIEPKRCNPYGVTSLRAPHPLDGRMRPTYIKRVVRSLLLCM